VREDPQLAEALSTLAVAEVFAWAYGLERQAITPNR
jgi:hypothetical protein